MITLDKLHIQQGNFSLSADIELSEGGIYAILGPSGSGKSTLLSALGGFCDGLSGRIFINGDDVTETPPANRPMSSMFQSDNLFPRMTVLENIKLGIKQGLPKIRDEEIAKLAESFAIDKELSKFPHQISGGQAARVALARVFLHNQPIWLLDEPFSALGPRRDRELRQHISNAIVSRRDQFVLFVSHQPSVVRAWSNYIVWVDRGIVHKPMKTKDFFDKIPDYAKHYF